MSTRIMPPRVMNQRGERTQRLAGGVEGAIMVF